MFYICVHRCSLHVLDHHLNKHTYSILKLREIFIKTYVLVMGNAALCHFLHIFVPIWEYLHCNINHTRNDRTNMITYKLTFNLTQSR